jgi:hypothetical protein
VTTAWIAFSSVGTGIRLSEERVGLLAVAEQIQGFY